VFAEKGIVFIPAADQRGIISNGVKGHALKQLLNCKISPSFSQEIPPKICLTKKDDWSILNEIPQ
jgi:hypothetical protein